MNEIHNLYYSLEKGEERRLFRNRFKELFNIYRDDTVYSKTKQDYTPAEIELMTAKMITDEIKDGR